MTAKSLTALLDPRRRVLAIANEIAGQRNIDVDSLLGSHRARKYAWARQELYWRAKQETGLGRVWLGKILGRDRQTIWWGIREYERRVRLSVRLQQGVGVNG